MAYTPLDLLSLESQLSPEELEITQSIRRFVSDQVMPVIGNFYDRGEFPHQLVKPIAELGLLGMTIEGYGCAGLHSSAYGLAMTELERGDSGIRSFVSVQGALCMYPIYKFGSEELKTKYLPEMAQGKLIGCFGLTEPDFGSNPSGMLTRAKKDGNHYVLNGNKMWITNGGISSLAIVWAKNDEGKIEGFVVDRDLPGFKVRNIEKKYSLRASVTSELIFEDCRVPASHKLNVVGLKGPFACLNQARFGIAFGAIGAAQACWTEALEYARSRIQFDKPIASFQLVQKKLVDMANEITKMQWTTLQVGRLADQQKLEPHHVSLVKMNNVSTALNIARTCRDILGASGITYEYQVGRHMLNLESVNTYEGTEDIHRLILGEKLTGIPAYR